MAETDASKTADTEGKHTPGPQYWLDHAKDGPNRYFIINGPLPQGLNDEFGYPICDSLNRHHCISPEEDEANGRLVLDALNSHARLERVNLALLSSVKELGEGLAAAMRIIAKHNLAEEFLAEARAAGVKDGIWNPRAQAAIKLCGEG